MSVDLAAAAYTLNGLRSFPTAITTVHDGRANGLITLSGSAGGIIPEAPRIRVGITKYNFSHDMIAGSGVLVLHVLGGGDLLDASLNIIETLAGSSARDGDKMGKLRTKPGVTGAPILLDALAYAEGRVVHVMDCDEDSMFVADVVASERLNKGSKLNIGDAWSALPPRWVEDYERNHVAQINSARRARGLPERDE
jgi:flavin reductase (DIM6/NTAB) family NADH-FMN oxidoreductase RutF